MNKKIFVYIWAYSTSMWRMTIAERCLIECSFSQMLIEQKVSPFQSYNKMWLKLWNTMCSMCPTLKLQINRLLRREGKKSVVGELCVGSREKEEEI